jgi:hypothetical protein
MTVKYMLGNSWAYLEGTFVRYTKFNIADMQEKVMKHEEDELTQLQTMYDYIHEMAERELKVNSKEDYIMHIGNPMKIKIVCVTVVYDKDGDRQTVLFTDDSTFLLNDTGKTIERLL